MIFDKFLNLLIVCFDGSLIFAMKLRYEEKFLGDSFSLNMKSFAFSQGIAPAEKNVTLPESSSNTSVLPRKKFEWILNELTIIYRFQRKSFH